MVDLVILGTIGLDTLKTPFGEAKDILGGSSMYAAYAASFFVKPGIVSIKGTDLEDSELQFLKDRGISLDGIESKGKNFRWSGVYEFDMNEAKTLKTELNSLMDFDPKLPDDYKKAKYLFLANVDPDIQLKVIDQMDSPEIIAIDTMNFWIDTKKDKLLEAIKKANILILNDGEARALFKTPNLILAGKEALKLGPQSVIIKKGEHGSLLFDKEGIFNCHSYPLENLVDPTGCGDSFGGSFLAHYSKNKDIRKAMVYGSVIASLNAEGMGLAKMKTITLEDIEARFKEMENIRKF